MNFTVEDAAYHRNGVGGAGFYTGLATCVVDGVPRQMLITFFPEHDSEGDPCPAGKNADGGYANGRVAVLDVGRLEDFGIRFDGNSWRGDKFYEVADAIVAAVSARV